MNVMPSRHDSWERQAHDTGLKSFVLDICRASQQDERLREELARDRLERFIGVITGEPRLANSSMLYYGLTSRRQ